MPTESPLDAGNNLTAVVTAAQSRKAPPFHAIAKYNEIFGTSITQLPIEDDGGSGTAEGHWEAGESPWCGW